MTQLGPQADSNFFDRLQLPNHWQVVPLKFALSRGQEGVKIGPFGSALRLETLTDTGLKVYGQENVIQADFGRGHRHVPLERASEFAQYLVRPGDLLVTMMGTAGRCEVVPQGAAVGILDSHLLRLRVDPGKLHPEFLRWFLNDSAWAKVQLDLMGGGSIMHGLNSSIVKNVSIGLPPMEEQGRIAAFLDHETARIDELVREQERLLKQVSERFSVLRESLLIGRLRPEEGETGRLVMAGERVIPDDLAIGSARPSHWKRIPLRWLVFMKSGDAITSDNITDAGSYPVYGGNGIRGFTERMNDTGPAVLIGRQGALCGNIQRVDGPRWVSEHAVVTRPQQPSDIGWLAELLEALDLGSYSQSAAQPGLAVDRIKALTVPVPPIREQRLIAKVLARERHQLDRLVSTISDYASVLLERRSALISAAVTGQLDLRDWRPPEVDAVAQVA